MGQQWKTWDYIALQAWECRWETEGVLPGADACLLVMLSSSDCCSALRNGWKCCCTAAAYITKLNRSTHACRSMCPCVSMSVCFLQGEPCELCPTLSEDMVNTVALHGKPGKKGEPGTAGIGEPGPRVRREPSFFVKSECFSGVWGIVAAIRYHFRAKGNGSILWLFWKS